MYMYVRNSTEELHKSGVAAIPLTDGAFSSTKQETLLGQVTSIGVL